MNSDIAKSFIKFREQCMWLQNCYNIDRNLYANKDTEPVLRRSAELFFSDLNKILVEYLILLIGRLTDNAKNGQNENLSILNIDEALKNENLCTEDISKLSSKLMTYSELTRAPRNKIIAHADKQTFLANEKLGQHTEIEEIQFFQNLQKYCDQVGRAVGVGPLDFRTQAGEGDVLDLIKALRDHSNKN